MITRTARRLATVTIGLAAAVAFVTPAAAAVTFDSANGTGFVGKGDVQVPFGWSNATLQKNAGGVSFSVSSVSEQVTSWTCVNERNEQTQERQLTTTTETQALFNSAARDGKKQVTGFNLTGFSALPTRTTTTGGPKLESCPNANSTYVLGTTVVGESTVISGGVYATHSGITNQIA